MVTIEQLRNCMPVLSDDHEQRLLSWLNDNEVHVQDMDVLGELIIEICDDVFTRGQMSTLID
jgi:hypothetical protein